LEKASAFAPPSGFPKRIRENARAGCGLSRAKTPFYIFFRRRRQYKIKEL